MRNRSMLKGLRLAALTLGTVGAALAFDATLPENASASEKPQPVVQDIVEGFEELVDLVLPDRSDRAQRHAHSPHTSEASNHERPARQKPWQPEIRPANNPREQRRHPISPRTWGVSDEDRPDGQKPWNPISPRTRETSDADRPDGQKPWNPISPRTREASDEDRPAIQKRWNPISPRTREASDEDRPDRQKPQQPAAGSTNTPREHQLPTGRGDAGADHERPSEEEHASESRTRQAPKLPAWHTERTEGLRGGLPAAGAHPGPILGAIGELTGGLAAVAELVLAPVAKILPPVLAPVTTIVTPILTPVAKVAAPVLAPVAKVAAPILAPVAKIAAPVLAPVAKIAAPILTPVLKVAAPVLAPVATVVQPVTETLAGVPGVDGLLDEVGKLLHPLIEPLHPVLSPVVTPIVEPLWPGLSPVLAPVLAVAAPMPGDSSPWPTPAPHDRTDRLALLPAAAGAAQSSEVDGDLADVDVRAATAGISQLHCEGGEPTARVGDLDAVPKRAQGDRHHSGGPAQQPAQTSTGSSSSPISPGLLRAGTPIAPELVLLGTARHSDAKATGREPQPDTRPA